MLSLKFIRENKDIVIKNLEKRKDKEKIKWVDDILSIDEKYRKDLGELEKLRHDKNNASQDINKLKKEGKDIKDAVKKLKELPEKIKKKEDKIEKTRKEIKSIQMRLPNILHESVPYGKDETENKIEKEWGKKTKFDFELKPHGELAQELGVANFEDAARVSGNGFYYLLGDLALLDFALQNFAIEKLTQKGYTLVEPPFMLRRKPYEGVTDLADFETMMYKVEGEDLYLIATSEHPIAAMMMGKILDEKDMPIKMCGISACFRKEIGSAGVDTKGLFRVHQFNKIEQFVFCKPEDSWKFHEELRKNAEEIFEELELPYRVVNICTGDIGIVAAKKYDIEVWMPREKKYREVVSCSNCTAYQATRLNIRYRKGNDKEYIHTLNSTAIATGRAMRAIIENYQQKDGSIIIPKALRKYMNNKKAITKK